MQVKIFKPAKNSMQSALQGNKWIIEGINRDKSKSEYNTGWASSKDMSNEIRMTFLTKEQAIEYAKKIFFEYQLIEPISIKIKKRSYAQNFIKKLV